MYKDNDNGNKDRILYEIHIYTGEVHEFSGLYYRATMNTYNGLVNQKFKKSGGGLFSPPGIVFVSGCNTEFLTDLKYTDMVLHSGIVRIFFEYRHVSINLNLTLNILF